MQTPPLIKLVNEMKQRVVVKREEISVQTPIFRSKIQEDEGPGGRMRQDLGISYEFFEWRNGDYVPLNEHIHVQQMKDLQVIDSSHYQFSGVNMTGVRLIGNNNYIPNIHNVQTHQESNEFAIRVETALIVDATTIFFEGYQRLQYATNGESKPILCNSNENWEYGISLSNFLKSVEVEGLSGFIAFDTAGFRSKFELEIFKINDKGLELVGRWNSSKNIEWILSESVNIESDMLSLKNTTFRVLIALTKPYGMLKETVSKMSGNDQYEGFAVDIIYEISKMLGFNYTFSVQADNVYGSLNQKTGQWNGMLRKVIDNEADLAITDLTITAERETAVDFTMPFMNLGMLYANSIRNVTISFISM
ncbi:glutamate receptor ionotropic, kainate 3-like [Copidosoma floridanum]|uniref:glutamate receptor ionotropic, kainate 3-like n=1 Tax=Copidosoma floridanum TaxID=29053 RepID=UPI000C6F85C2|nr:glutamate receptor ionotropic, kainate 3-like [Copidosoma floridanum]